MKSLLALALGTLALGIAEFVMMGVLPYVAQDLGITVKEAGHFISAYALGVCVGAWLLVGAYKMQLKYVLLGLAALIGIGNTLAALAPNYEMLMLARFVSGLPHGAFFGVGSIVAAQLAPGGRQARAVSVMVSGMTIANLLGVPLGTYLSLHTSWRSVFFLVGVIGLLLVYAIWRYVPKVPMLPQKGGLLGQFAFMKNKAPWLIWGATMLGNSGTFAWYSYVNPHLTQVAGFSDNAVGILMLMAGASMVIGNFIGGRLADRYPAGKVAAWINIGVALGLFGIFLFGHVSWVAVVLMCLVTMCMFAFSSPLQTTIINYSPGGMLLGAAGIQMAFNLGNAIGAYNGGIMLKNGYQYPALIGVPFALLGFACLWYFHKKIEQKQL